MNDAATASIAAPPCQDRWPGAVPASVSAGGFGRTGAGDVGQSSPRLHFQRRAPARVMRRVEGTSLRAVQVERKAVAITGATQPGADS